ncbi:MAG: hypothetical protein ABI836_11995 [Gemmatimonadota bacterium]
MSIKLSSRQQAQLGFLDMAFSKVQRVQSLIEKLATPSEAETAGRSLARISDEIKSGASGMGLSKIADSAANIGSLVRRSGAIPQRMRSLREGLATLKINWDGARRSASIPEVQHSEEV